MTRITAAILVYLGSRAAWERASANAYAGATAMVSTLFSLAANVIIVLLCFIDTRTCTGVRVAHSHDMGCCENRYVGV
jgi:hypothetical protein